MRAIILLLISLCTFSCANQSPLEKEYKKLKRSSVVIPENLSFIINGKDTIVTCFHAKKMKCVMYIDSSYCNTCNVDRLLDWKPFIEKYSRYRDFAFYFIFEPKQKEIAEIKDLIKELGINYPIVLDEQRIFRQHNPDMTYNKSLNVFLLYEGKVVFIGNPVYDRQLKKLFEENIEKCLVENIR